MKENEEILKRLDEIKKLLEEIKTKSQSEIHHHYAPSYPSQPYQQPYGTGTPWYPYYGTIC